MPTSRAIASALVLASQQHVPAQSIGIDIDPPVIQIARRKFLRAGVQTALIEAGAQRLPLADASLDVTVSSLILSYVKLSPQGRKKAKTSNILPVTDQHGYIVVTTNLVAGNHNDSYELKATLRMLFSSLRRLGIAYRGAYFNADSSFDTRQARKMLWNYGVIPNIPENKRNRKTPKRATSSPPERSVRRTWAR